MPNTDFFNNGSVFSGIGGASVTSTSSTLYNRSRAVFIGRSTDYDFTFDGTNWITFQGCLSGTLLPLQVIGARVTTGTAAPSSGDIVFVY